MLTPENKETISKSEPKAKIAHILGYESTYYVNPNRLTAVLYNDSYKLINQSYAEESKWVVQTTNPYVKTNMLIANFSNAPASIHWGKDFGTMLDSKPHSKKVVYIGHRKDLGTVPQLDKYFTANFATVNNEKVQILNPTATSEVLYTTSNGQPWALRDGTLWIIANDNFITSGGTIKFIDDLDILGKNIGASVNDKSIQKVNGETATIVPSLTTGNYVYTVSVSNNDFKGQPILLGLALYNDNKLADMIINKEIINAMDTEVFKIYINVPTVQKGYRLKGFVWDRISGMVPLDNSIELKH